MFSKTKERSLDKYKLSHSKQDEQREKRAKQRSKSFESNSEREARLKLIKNWFYKKAEISFPKRSPWIVRHNISTTRVIFAENVFWVTNLGAHFIFRQLWYWETADSWAMVFLPRQQHFSVSQKPGLCGWSGEVGGNAAQSKKAQSRLNSDWLKKSGSSAQLMSTTQSLSAAKAWTILVSYSTWWMQCLTENFLTLISEATEDDNSTKQKCCLSGFGTRHIVYLNGLLRYSSRDWSEHSWRMMSA